ncbi:unnamed protein product [Prorocentrum cordatum]|uniref:G-patch domain-containing protein n=1 Tax=Prorocentrum cordatum TaxID=2364126 RepID=A0ABN9SZ76_9DINO|nr:unnamed protein product [Polarella glacialis]
MPGTGQTLARSTAWPAMLAMLFGLAFLLFGNFGPLRASKVLSSTRRIPEARPGSAASGPIAGRARIGPDERGGLGKEGTRNLLHAAGFSPTEGPIPRYMGAGRRRENQPRELNFCW